ncbi:hypothetical protein BCR41DRAFT_381050 [Lobosporangium transversale]|uniref:Uncharacterized protein n=1 Tax=Lobosporangium transversale TaxID=64571 RepID=A0A1Y2GLL4_9FUNG|nr:hypothetical protein BCR41DRAFT_381050 [Lobosporangium transversale]ORZ14854.1 hypothetical protein BCR41DRAFT_381050 [Lobosporangium transversale]|eukprot:XP_021880986.1 hypothetical protein BCR41DRAFT_381050 [Lobosporangium transversale]
MSYTRSDSAIVPNALHDDDPTWGMGFSVIVTICSLLGLVFCFRRASTLLPRNLNIQLQLFGGDNSDRNGLGIGRRGPIALSDDDLEGATGLEWEDLEAQFHGEGYEDGLDGGDGDGDEDGNEYHEEEMENMTAGSRLLKPISRQNRYLDEDEDDEEEEEGQEMMGGVNARYRDDDEEDNSDGDEQSRRRST